MKLAKGMDLGDTVLAKVISNRIIHSAPTQQQHRSRKQLLDVLRQLLRERGSLSRKIIDEAEGMPAVGTYQKRSGVLPAYELIGYATTSPRPI